ncbi:VTT domain-containing protein [Cohnella faecalis]|uniref:Alkaline phosphatase n=1 Tax=Cohnella faecalis TaxID=2315694 RepID=A0A398CLZ9_9BACL|nr:VTT domain-containing protein [Cohnella faecalis]RIE03465.1 alkaline phosphatase [Cohnella faecalis]
MNFLHNAMNHYGYWVLGLGLMLEVLALPLPGEFLMSYAGLLVFEGKLNWFASMLAAGAGSSLGVTAAYWIGYAAGRPFFEKVGSRIHLGPDKLDKASVWFDKYGNKVLLIAYYIPGIRHFTGYFAGVTRLPFRTFALYAYTGAFIWTGLFITLGKILGPQWDHFHHSIRKYLIFAGILGAILLLAYYTIKNRKVRVKQAVLRFIANGSSAFRTVRKAEWAIAIACLVLVAAVTWAVVIIQDFLAHEFSDFDQIAPLVIHAVFDESWKSLFSGTMQAASPIILAPIVVLSLIAVWKLRGKRLEEAALYSFGIFGGIIWEYGLRHLFAGTGPELSAYSFPCEPVSLIMVVFGLSAYYVGRSVRRRRIQISLGGVAVIASLFAGVACIYLNRYDASDVTAAFAFTGVWLSSNVVLVELFRMLRKTQKQTRPSDSG